MKDRRKGKMVSLHFHTPSTNNISGLPSNFKDLFNKAAKDLFEKTKKRSIEFEQGTPYSRDEKAKLCATKFGGIPYWPRDMKYPQNSKGQDLILVAQLNFSELPHLEHFPDEGLIQFFCENDYGESGIWTHKSNGVKVIYHKKADVDKAVEVEHSSLNLYMEDFPLHHVWYPKAKVVEIGVNSSIESYEEMLIPLLCEVFDTNWKTYSDLPWALRELYFDNPYAKDSTGGHRCGGYPYGVQHDPTPLSSEMKNPVLLFQQDSQGEVAGDGIMWGDVGLCQYFISESDLKSLNFNKVYFDYQCY